MRERELRKTVFLPLRRRKHGNMDTKSTEIRPDQAELTHSTSCTAGFTWFRDGKMRSRGLVMVASSVVRWATEPLVS